MLVHFRSGFNATMIPFSAQGLWKDDSWWNPRKHEVICLGYGCICLWASLYPTHSHGTSSNIADIRWSASSGKACMSRC